MPSVALPVLLESGQTTVAELAEAIRVSYQTATSVLDLFGRYEVVTPRKSKPGGTGKPGRPRCVFVLVDVTGFVAARQKRLDVETPQVRADFWRRVHGWEEELHAMRPALIDLGLD